MAEVETKETKPKKEKKPKLVIQFHPFSEDPKMEKNLKMMGEVVKDVLAKRKDAFEKAENKYIADKEKLNEVAELIQASQQGDFTAKATYEEFLKILDDVKLGMETSLEGKEKKKGSLESTISAISHEIKDEQPNVKEYLLSLKEELEKVESSITNLETDLGYITIQIDLLDNARKAAASAQGA